MIGERRLIVVGGCAPAHCENGVYVFGCVSGQVKTVFDQELLAAEAQDTSPDKLVLSVAWRTEGDNGAFSASMNNLMTYVWNASLQNYILSSMYFSPRQP